jgi:hypothetical protein
MKPATVIAPLALVVALSGTAVAADNPTGGVIHLGHHNTATKSTTFADSKGTPLALTAKKGKGPLDVHGDTTKIGSLDGAELGGLSATSLRAQDLEFTKPGETTFTVPKGFTHMLVLLVGAGGGGGRGTSGGDVGTGGGEGGRLLVWVPAKAGTQWIASVSPGAAGATNASDGGAAFESTVFTRNRSENLGDALGGLPGNNGGACTNGQVETLAGGDGAQPNGSGPGSSLGAVAVAARDGSPGDAASWTCDLGGVDGSAGGNAGVVGGGGDGGGDGSPGHSTDGQAGSPGGVFVEFLR